MATKCCMVLYKTARVQATESLTYHDKYGLNAALLDRWSYRFEHGSVAKVDVKIRGRGQHKPVEHGRCHFVVQCGRRIVSSGDSLENLGGRSEEGGGKGEEQ